MKNWRGRPLESYQVVVNLIGATTTETGLRVRADFDREFYPTKTFPTKVLSDSLGRIGSLKRTSDKSLFPMALGSCGHRITHQLRPINMNGRSILSETSTKVKVTDTELATVDLHPHHFHGEWNYTIKHYN